MSGIVFRLLSKLQVKKLYYALTPPRAINRAKCNLVSEREYQEAVDTLQKFHSDEGSSCIFDKIKIDPVYDLDVIVPVYNVEKYVKDCVDSILSQKTKYSFRVILIDDGSPDRSGQIIDELYADKPNVLIIHQQNAGHSGARNTGLRLLKSKYVTFVDSDDMMADGAVEALLNTAFQYNADCVQGGFNRFSESGIKTGRVYPNKKDDVKSSIAGFPWGKVFKSELWNGICFPDKYWYEDTVIRNVISFKIKVFYTISDIVYLYRRNMAGVTYTALGKPKSIDTLWVYLRCYKDQQTLGFKWEQCDFESLLRHTSLGERRISRLDIKIRKAAFTVWRHFVIERMWDGENQHMGSRGKMRQLQKRKMFCDVCKRKRG